MCEETSISFKDRSLGKDSRFYSEYSRIALGVGFELRGNYPDFYNVSPSLAILFRMDSRRARARLKSPVGGYHNSPFKKMR